MAKRSVAATTSSIHVRRSLSPGLTVSSSALSNDVRHSCLGGRPFGLPDCPLTNRLPTGLFPPGLSRSPFIGLLCALASTREFSPVSWLFISHGPQRLNALIRVLVRGPIPVPRPPSE